MEVSTTRGDHEPSRYYQHILNTVIALIFSSFYIFFFFFFWDKACFKHKPFSSFSGIPHPSALSPGRIKSFSYPLPKGTAAEDLWTGHFSCLFHRSSKKGHLYPVGITAHLRMAGAGCEWRARGWASYLLTVHSY